MKVKIRDIAVIKNGSTPSTNDSGNYDGDIIWITPKDLSNQQSKYILSGERNITQKGLRSCSASLLPKGSLLLSSRAPIGLLAIADNECCTNQGFKNIVVNRNKVNNEFLYYYLKLNIASIEKLGGGTTFKELSKSILEEYIVELPNNTTQNAIVNILSKLDRKIELNNQITTELEKITRALYVWFFVQNNNNNWAKKPLIELIKETKSGDWGKDTIQGNYTKKVLCVRGTDIDTPLNNTPTRYILEKNNNKLLTTGDFIIEISGGSPTQSTGRMTCILQETLDSFDIPLIFSNFCKGISLKDNNLLYYFNILWKELYDNNVFFDYEGKTNGIKNLLFDIFAKSYKVVIPDNDTLTKFNNIVKPIFSQIAKNRSQSAELVALRDFLLPLLMNGQVTIENAQKDEQVAAALANIIIMPTFEQWKQQSGIAARSESGGISEETLKTMYNAFCEKVRNDDGAKKNRNKKPRK
jgi:type I restriction enzyme S subunit